MNSTVCPNCQNDISQNFCPNCGQKRIKGRLQWKELFDEFRDKVFGVEKGLLHTLVMMLKKPGTPAKDYINGIRKKYASPVQYYLLAVTLIFLSFELFNVMDNIGQNEMFEQISNSDDFDEEKKEFMSNYFAYFSKNMKTLTFIAFPFQLIWIYVLFKKYKFSLLECAVCLLYMEGTTSIIQVFTAPFYNFPYGMEIMSIFSTVLAIYSIIVLKRFFNSGWMRAIFSYMLYYITLIISISIGTFAIIIAEKLLAS